ncbi:hypothetical protein [Deinococcus sp. QL22]|uniref:hypothetical protein n=1 Tax=Deinococcus sp. QL22 TaxID=2939437 RepID=UPI0020175BAD|nr:hypothetical protein [Deinococcus sp. QL22]UQN09340.1 hypothetical protein M1R55_22505 [Deinococcus sp. QL22]
MIADLWPLLAGCRIVAFNAELDRARLQTSHEAHGLIADGDPPRWRCAMEAFGPLHWRLIGLPRGLALGVAARGVPSDGRFLQKRRPTGRLAAHRRWPGGSPPWPSANSLP